METLSLSGAESSGVSAISVGVDDISETPQNWTIYRKPDQSGQEWNDLCDSIEENGINTPLELSSDYYVISGHRRLAAARHVGLEQVPAFIRSDITIGEMDDAERTLLLTERNRGTRVKSDSEMYLESAAQVDPEEAIRTVEARRTEHFNKAKGCGVEVFSVGNIRRTDPKGCREEMLSAAIDIILEYRREMGNVAIAGRSIHYQLLSKQVRTSTYKTGYIYGTRPGSADLLSKLLTDARSAGLIDADWIDDTTRPCYTIATSSVTKYIMEQSRKVFMNFFGNIHADQENHVELLLEKNTLFSLFRSKVAYPLRLPLTCMRGYGGYPAARDVSKRFKESGKRNMIVVYISDLDPEGLNMPSAFKKYLNYDFGVDCTVLRAAVTMDQVHKFNLPSDADVKPLGCRAKGYVQQYGNRCWELDSMPPQLLVDEAIKVAKGCLDIDILNRAFEKEKINDVKLARLNAAIQSFTKVKVAEIFGDDATDLLEAIEEAGQ